MRLKLSQRFNLYIGSILLAGIALVILYDVRTNEELFRELGTGEAERLTRAVFDQLYTSMRLGGGRAENRAIVARFSRMEGIEEIRVIHGPILDKEYGIEEDEIPKDEHERGALEGEASGVVERSKAGYRTARYVRPFVLQQDCLRCHTGKVGMVNGAVSVKISLARYEGLFRSHTINFIIGGGAIFMAISAVILMTVRKRLLKPIDAIEEGIEAFSAGDLGHRIGIRTGDELEELGSRLNAMAASLQAATVKLQDLNEKHSRLVHMALDAIVLIDIETRKFIEANPAAVIMTGYSKEELVQKKDIELWPRESRDVYEQFFRRWVHDGKGYLHDALIIKQDGFSVPVEIAASVLDINGKRYVQEIWRDLSERKGFEETFRRHIVELEKTVQDRTATLNSSLKELEDAYRKLKDSEQKLIQSAKLISLGEMGAGIAHELNSPLAGILSITEVLLNRTTDDDPSRFLLTKIKDAAVRSKYIIMDMLAYARPSKGEYAPFFLNETIKATLLLFISEIKTTSIEIIPELDPELPKVFGNKGQIMEVLLNIVKNARDAMEGSGKIFVSTKVVKEDERTYSVAEIRDTGPGIPDGLMDKIFDPFFTTKQKGGGLNIGLGLSISQSIIKEHGGKIEVESRKKEGACFRVFLPVYEGEKEP